jgi:RNA polymerase sigma-70 factor, ECF subfamily
VGIRGSVTLDTVGNVADHIPVLLGWLARHGIEPAGPPFLRYHVIDMARQLDVEAGVPLHEPVDGDADVTPGNLPAGRYVSATHVGSFGGLVDATTALLAWAEDQDLACDVQRSPDGDAWACRLEVFHTNPLQEPDPTRQAIELAFKLA